MGAAAFVMASQPSLMKSSSSSSAAFSLAMKSLLMSHLTDSSPLRWTSSKTINGKKMESHSYCLQGCQSNRQDNGGEEDGCATVICSISLCYLICQPHQCKSCEVELRYSQKQQFLSAKEYAEGHSICICSCEW